MLPKVQYVHHVVISKAEQLQIKSMALQKIVVLSTAHNFRAHR